MSHDTRDEDPIQATEQERSAAFEWLRDVALSLENDIPISFDGPDHARHAAVALQAWKLSADAAKAAESEKAMSKIVEASAPQIEEAARNMAKAAVIGVGVGPLPSALSAEVRRFQGGLTNAQLAEAWEKKLPGVTPTDRELSAFAIGIEVGETLTRSATAATSLDQVNELLAILNGDGGHRRAAVGQQQAAKEAIEKVLRMMQLLAENDLLERLASDRSSK